MSSVLVVLLRTSLCRMGTLIIGVTVVPRGWRNSALFAGVLVEDEAGVVDVGVVVGVGEAQLGRNRLVLVATWLVCRILD